MLSRPGNSKAFGVSQFLNELDGLKKTTGTGRVFILIATNRPNMIDGAFLRSGRISASAYIGLPNLETRREIVEAALKDAPLAADVDLDRLAEVTEGYSCAELYHRSNGGGICNLARNYAGRRWVERIKLNKSEELIAERITWADLEEAINNVTASSTRDAERIRENEKFYAMMSSGKKIVTDSSDAGDDSF